MTENNAFLLEAYELEYNTIDYDVFNANRKVLSYEAGTLPWPPVSVLHTCPVLARFGHAWTLSRHAWKVLFFFNNKKILFEIWIC